LTERRRPAGLRELLRAAGWRRTLLVLAVIVAVVVLFLVAGHQLELRLDAIEARVAGLGPWAIPSFVALFVLATSFLIPDTLLCLVAGAAFGLGWGTVAVAVGSVLGNALQYVLGHWMLRARFEREIQARPALATIRRAVRRDELRLQALLRLTPISPALTSYVLGSAGVRFGGFMAACGGLAFNLCVAVYLGHAGRGMVRAADEGVEGRHLRILVLALGALACVAVVVWVSTLARRALAEAVDELDAPSPETHGAETPGSG
jgi:uncharacterized membrane protein YdjX (TVP38/TMEM64 family)